MFLFVTVFVDMIAYGIVVPLLPFYVWQYAPGAALVGLLGSLYAAMQWQSFAKVIGVTAGDLHFPSF